MTPERVPTDTSVFLAAVGDVRVQVVEEGAGLAAGWVLVVGDFEVVLVVAVDDLRAGLVGALAYELVAVFLVDMAVEHVFRLVAVHQVIKAAETMVRKVIEVAIALGRGMGDQDVEAIVEGDIALHFADAGEHFSLGVHVLAIMVAHGTAKPHDAEPLEVIYLIIYVDAAERRLGIVLPVVIASDVQKRHISHRDDVLQVVRVQVTARDDQVNSFGHFFIVKIP